ncbi:MAG: dihydropyrimidinase [Candidatus Limiplasma sp.]|nr:dihydropyrimidinase [Candidatus Limiplasma sp.]
MKIIKGGTLVSGARAWQGDLAVENGKIAAVEPSLSPNPGDEVIDAAGCLVFPGFIDAHTHFDMDNGVTVTADTFATGTAAALRGGTTVIVDFATQDRGGSLQDALDTWQKKAQGVSSCHVAFHMAITSWDEATRREVSRMAAQGVTSFKAYLAYDALRVDDAQLMDILAAVKDVGGLLGVHCENGTLINALVDEQKRLGHLSPAAHPLSRPPEAEAEAISRLCYVARLVDWPVTVVHLSTELGLAEVEKARSMGQRVIAETCPQYLTLTEEKYREPGFEGAKYVCSPPLRRESDRQALIRAVREGRIDTLATDHCSFNFHGQKTLGEADFSRIPNGLPGVEHRPALVYSALVEPGLISPRDMCRLLSENPAKLYGMYPHKGALLPGSDADIVIWEGGLSETLSASNQLQNVDYTPFEGMRIAGRARDVLLGGERAVQNGEVAARNLGRYVARGPMVLP